MDGRLRRSEPRRDQGAIAQSSKIASDSLRFLTAMLRDFKRGTQLRRTQRTMHLHRYVSVFACSLIAYLAIRL
jgi:hypothetical protein